MNKLWETYRQKKGTRIELISVPLLHKLADQLGYSPEKTEDYCLEVWKYFKSAPPDLEIILDALDRVGVKQAPPSWIAYTISVPGQLEDRAPEQKERKPDIPRLEPQVVTQIKSKIPSEVRSRIHASYGLQWNNILDRERVNPDRLERCPHGVPVGRDCCICNEKKFRENTGIE